MLLVVAFGVRMTHLAALASTPFFKGLVVDARAYALDAEAVLAHGTIDSGFYRPPLYPYVRAALTWVGLGSPWCLGIVHAVMGTAVVGLMAAISYRLVSPNHPTLQRRSAVIAAAIAACYGPLIITDVEMIPSVWVNTMIACAFFAALSGRRTWMPEAVSGGCLGIASLGWAPAVLLAIPLLCLRRARAVQQTLIFVGAMLIFPALTAQHNARHDAAGIVVSANLGINLWLGNANDWRASVAARPGIRYDLEYQRPTRAGAVSQPAREAYYLSLVAERARAAPGDAVLRTLEKYYYFWYGGEIRRDQDMEWRRQVSRVAQLSMWDFGVKFPFGLLVPLAVLCPGSSLRPRAKLYLWLGALLYAGVLSCFILGSRYRLPILPLLLPLAAHAIAWLIQQPAIFVRSRIVLASAAAIMIVINLPSAFAKSFAASPTELLLLEGQSFENQSDVLRALSATNAAVKLSPSDPDAHLQLGRLLMNEGQLEVAAYHFRVAGKLVSESEAPWILHGHAMIQLRRYEDAIYNLQQALVRNPYHREALRDLTMTYALSGQSERSRAMLQRYKDAGYRDDQTAFHVARLILQHGETSTALPILTDLHQRHPDWKAVSDLIARAGVR